MLFRPRCTGLIEKHCDRLPVRDTSPVISLGVGSTPLIQLQNIPRMIGKDVDRYVKYEDLDPAGSLEDRGMNTVVIGCNANLPLVKDAILGNLPGS